MKKQIFILVVFVWVIFANANKSYGQAIAGSAPRGIGCADDALHPMAGKSYTYKASSNQAGNYTFWATKNSNFITSSGTAPSQVTTTNMAGRLTTTVGLLSTTNYATPGITDNVQITWSDATLKATIPASAPTFVVVNQVGICANNLKVWSIDPIVAFTVDIKNMKNTDKSTLAYDDVLENQCFDVVRGATYSANKVNYDFGTQYLYWEVVAANFSVEYTPTFAISGLGNGQTATIEWDELSTFASPTTAVAIVNGTSIASATKVSSSLTNTSAGISIYVRVTVKNNNFQGIASTPITLAVDGLNSVGDWDILNNTVAAPTPLTCVVTTASDQADAATQILNPRPTVNSTTVGNAPTYLNPGLFVTGNETN